MNDLDAPLEAIDATRDGAVRLATLVSLAVCIEPHLLRRARLVLAPGMPVSAEADLWFSPLVASSSPRAIVLHAEVAAILRGRLAGDEPLLEHAHAVIEAAHARAAPTLRLEEDAIWSALTLGEEAVNAALGRAVATMREQPKRSLGLSRWALRAMPTLPLSARHTDAARLLEGAAELHMTRSFRSLQALPASLSSLVVPPDLPRVQIGIRLLAGGVEVSEPPAPGAHPVLVPDATPIVLVLRELDRSAGRSVEVPRAAVNVFPLHSALLGEPPQITLTLSDGEVYALRASVSQRAPQTRAKSHDETDDRRMDVVFDGGGVQAIALGGAYREMTDHGYTPECVAGTSGGAIIASLVACGFTGPEIEEVSLHRMNFPQFEDRSFATRFAGTSQAGEFFKTHGLHSGDYLLDWMRELLKEKGITKFGQLRDPHATVEARTYRLQVIASDLSAGRMLILPRDADKLGFEADELEIALAVRMSMSIPIFFKPVTVRDARLRNHVIVDGGLLSNYPIWLLDAPPGRVPEFPTFGMLLVAAHQNAPPMQASPSDQLADVTSVLGFLRAIQDAVTETRSRMRVDQADYARTIAIPTLGVKTTDFDISREHTQALFDSGRSAAGSFLKTWSFEAYRERFPGGAPRSGVSR